MHWSQDRDDTIPNLVTMAQLATFYGKQWGPLIPKEHQFEFTMYVNTIPENVARYNTEQGRVDLVIEFITRKKEKLHE